MCFTCNSRHDLVWMTGQAPALPSPRGVCKGVITGVPPSACESCPTATTGTVASRRPPHTFMGWCTRDDTSTSRSYGGAPGGRGLDTNGVKVVGTVGDSMMPVKGGGSPGFTCWLPAGPSCHKLLP